MVSNAATRLAVTFLFALVTVSCGGPDRVDLAADLPYISGAGLDVHFPAQTGPWPLIVLFHGAGLEREDYRQFAERLAEEGAVVFNTDWDPLPDRTALALEEIACAARYAREQGSGYGGNPERLVLVAHSTAAVYVGEVATSGDDYVGACENEGSALPDALVILAPAQVPGGVPWHYTSLGGNPNLEVAVVHGTDDDVVAPRLSERTVQVLGEAGYSVTLDLVSGGHNDLVSIGAAAESEASEKTVSVIMDLANPPG